MENSKDYLGKKVKVVMDRPFGTKHPKWGFVYETNYGYIPNTVSGDGEELDAYVLGVDEPLNEFEGVVIAIIKRTDQDDDKLIVVGGDGTLHRFVNGIRHIQNNSEVYLYRGGTGNDFGREFPKQMLINITEYIKNLPVVKVNGKDELFLNGCGFGVDGAVCNMMNDSQNKKKGLNYFKSAIMLLRNFKRYDLDIEIDGVLHTYKNVWFAVVNNGKYFGGGMKITPSSDRTDRVLEACIVHSVSFWKILFIFPTIFIGKHMLFKEVGISLVTGRKFSAKASAPQIFQTDGEVIQSVESFEIEITE